MYPGLKTISICFFLYFLSIKGDLVAVNVLDYYNIFFAMNYVFSTAQTELSLAPYNTVAKSMLRRYTSFYICSLQFDIILIINTA